MTGTLAGKVAVVTGGGAGLGRAIATRFHAAGATVVIADVSGEQDSAAKELGERATAAHVDVAVPAEVQAFFDRTISEHGHIDVLCNNAGIDGPIAYTTDVAVEDFDRVVAVNLRGVFLGMKYVIPSMVRNGGGSIINISSVGGLVGAAGTPAYLATKHGVIGLTKGTAIEYAQAKVRVNALCPGAMATGMLQSLPKEMIDFVASNHPVGRIAQPDEIAAAALFLAGDDASFVTGAVWTVDGGYTAQ